MPKHDYLFVDESGDPGYAIDPRSNELLSTPYYTAAVLHVVDDAFRDINRHIASFRFYRGLYKELKIPIGKQGFRQIIEPVGFLARERKGVYVSAVYLEKERYTGRYLKPGGERPQNPVWFRNLVLRRLLEHHFGAYELQSSRYDLVLDRIDATKDDYENLEEYLVGNRNIPSPNYITHASSIYVEGLQIVHHIANGFKNVALGGGVPDELTFVNAREITH